MSDAIKFDICCAARILFRAGLSAGNAGHLSVSTGSNQMLVNRFGPSFATLTPKDILTCDYHGGVLEGQGAVNETIQLHGVIHRYNPGIVAIVHTHPPAVVTYGTFRRVPEVYDQESCLLAGEVSVIEEDYPGLAATEDRVRPMAAALGKTRVVILPNHGAITTGPDIQHATILMLLLEGMVQRNLAVAAAARATGWTPKPIPHETALRTKDEIASKIAFLQPYWQDLLTRMERTDSDFFAQRPKGAAV
ncbi:MAG TPA: class II aldolase/adducin family protein [Candidatus Acidoferrales bacterium]|nr:class II aldolase/adducin family protein [Candidatus Acidoferrales bacterium]